MNTYYVLLTGARNNSGDFLIENGARELLQLLRPDRGVQVFNAWDELDADKLDVVNSSCGLLLTGGPSLREDMYPGIYPLVEELHDITVPIIMYGVGWKDYRGTWENTKNYPLSGPTEELIGRIFDHGYSSSVRDYHSLHVLKNRGFDNVLMTGCPTLYIRDHPKGYPDSKESLEAVVFSVGSSYEWNGKVEREQKRLILYLRDYFQDASFNVLFHHSIAEKRNGGAVSSSNIFQANRELAGWLRKKGIAYQDISGSSGEMIRVYSQADLHIGYRVHAHIVMNRMSKPSFLISEDGRGVALNEILPGGIIYGPHHNHVEGLNLLGKAFRKFGLIGLSRSGRQDTLGLLKKRLEQEIGQGFPRLKTGAAGIDFHYPVMKRFIKQLP